MKIPKAIEQATAFHHPNELNILVAYLGQRADLPREFIVSDALDIRDPDEWGGFLTKSEMRNLTVKS